MKLATIANTNLPQICVIPTAEIALESIITTAPAF